MARKASKQLEVRPQEVEVKSPGVASAKKKPKPKKTANKEVAIVLAKTTASDLLPASKQDSLAAWFGLYLGIEVGIPKTGEKANTFKAKRGDLERFLSFLGQHAGDDHPDGWTKAASRSFVRWFQKQTSPTTGRTYAATTVDRALATLRHAARWIQKRRPFLAGYPMEGIKDTVTSKPKWKGLDQAKRQEVSRLISAAEQLTKIQTQKNQSPYRSQALLMVGLDSALRPSEILDLEFSQYDGKGFTNVVLKGGTVADRVPLGKLGREALDEYIETERGEEEGALFQNRKGNRVPIQHFQRALDGIAAQANARQPAERHIKVTPHILRHTALRKLCETRGIEFAKKRANHTSDRHIWRYVSPDDEQLEDAIEEQSWD